MRHRHSRKYSPQVRRQIYLPAAVTLPLVVVFLIRFEVEPWTALALGAVYSFLFLMVGFLVLWPWLVVAGLGITAAWLVWSNVGHLVGSGDRARQPSAVNRQGMSLTPGAKDQPVLHETGSRRAELGCLASVVLVPLLVALVGAVAYNAHTVSCSMADQAACPQVRYEDIHFLNQDEDGITDPYSMDFREPVWPEWMVESGPPNYPLLENADWAAVYRTWFDGDYWVACRRLAIDSIRCNLLDGYDDGPPS